MANVDPNILYGFLAFICLLLVALIGIQIRQSFAIGRLEGLVARVDGLEGRMQRLEDQMSALRAEVAEVKGMLFSLNRSIDFLMRHHHNDAGQVVIVPAEEVAAD